MNKRKGISLIVLIITIVVIIILAAAVILTISKNNPVESAKKATFVSDLSSYQDELSMYIGNEYIKAQGNYDIATLDNKALEEVIEINSKYNEKFAIINGKIAGTDKLTEQEKEWAQSVTGETGSVTQTYPIEYVDADGKIAYIPKDFKVSEVATEQKIDTGLVIKDKIGNEFVWIPVDYTNDEDFATIFVRKQGYRDGSLQTDYPFTSFNEPYRSANQSEKDEYTAMITSVKKYKGYYIARYEASKDSSENAQSKPNVTPWNNIFWGNSMTDLSGGAVEKARAMYPMSSAKEGNAVSTLCYGVQWDIAIDFIEKYGIKDTTVRRDSTGKGNNRGTQDINAINTGSNASYALNNIYDMAGNVYEWTMETYGNNRAVRGGGYSISGIGNPISHRTHYTTKNVGAHLGFRVALYIM